MDQQTSPHFAAIHATTILGVLRDGRAAIAGDGQVTVGDMVMKTSAQKVRRLYHDRILTGFAGASSDAFTLYTRFEAQLEQHKGNLQRAAVELAKEWRMDRALRRLDAMLAVLDNTTALIISGSGDVVVPDDGIVAIGSGGPMALAAARALLRHAPQLDPAAIAREALTVAASICIYTNDKITLETLDA